MKKVILYTMKGCSHCDDMKESLKKSKIKFIGRDIDKYKKEYDLFVEATGNEFIPAFMLLSVNEKNETSDVVLMVPDDDFEDINEAMVKVKQYLK
jgi:glutaredoxin|tara:strand:- start:3269 stop:3553 length:285 start_codon:yes stop_codon:yes gene_type:complete